MKKLLLLILIPILFLTACTLQPPFGAVDLTGKYNQSEIKNKYQLEGTKLKRAVKDDPKDMVRVEIGDKSLGGLDGNIMLEPKLTISRWDEVSFSIKPKNYNKVILKDRIVKFAGDKIIFETPKEDYQLYEMPISKDLPEGGFEYEWILKEKPTTNKVEFQLETQGLDFFYQPPLTEQEVKDGASRPENVEGSYAVYASEQKTNWTGGKEYKVGKVGHIYRPKIIDSAGNWAWGELLIKNGILSVTIPQDFLDKAVYPVRHSAGFTFGYTTDGLSETFLKDAIQGYAVDNLNLANITLSKVTARIKAYSSSYYGNVKAGLYSGASLPGVDATFYYVDGSTNVYCNWVDYPTPNTDFALSYSGDLTENYYFPVWWPDNYTKMAYDSGTAGWQIYNGLAYGNWPASFIYTNVGQNYKFTVYVTYNTGSSNTCTYSGSGNWNVLQSDNCYITSSVYVNGSFNLIGSTTGMFGCKAGITVSAKGYNFGAPTNFDAKCLNYHQ